VHGPGAKRKTLRSLFSEIEGPDDPGASWPADKAKSETRIRGVDRAQDLDQRESEVPKRADGRRVVLPGRERGSGVQPEVSAHISISHTGAAYPQMSWVLENPPLPSRLDPLAHTAKNELVGASVLSAVAGYVDTAGFLSLFGMFTAHVTGDIIAGSAMVAEHAPMGFFARIAMIPIFMMSVAGATLLARAIRRRGHAPLVPLLALMTTMLALFCAAGVICRPFIRGPDGWAVCLIGSTGVAAMAIQNMLMRYSLGGWSPTTIMTGNLTQVAIHIVEIAFPSTRPQSRRKATIRLVKFGLPLLGFILGASLSAFVTHLVGFWSIALPTAAVGSMTVWQWRKRAILTSEMTPTVNIRRSR
jgi:uncharacterized membrane protein YoaK (UPF0700 family)